MSARCPEYLQPSLPQSWGGKAVAVVTEPKQCLHHHETEDAVSHPWLC